MMTGREPEDTFADSLGETPAARNWQVPSFAPMTASDRI
jgi:hypothetical protein